MKALMKLPRTLIAALTLAVALVGVGPAYAAGNGQTDTGAQKSNFDPLLFARGAKLWAQTCASCHNLRDPKELTDAEWDVAMGQMWVRAGLTAEEVKAITAFLKASN